MLKGDETDRKLGNPYRSSDSKLWALRSVTSASGPDRAVVEEEMEEPVEEVAVEDDDEEVTGGTVMTALTTGSGCDTDRFNWPSRSDTLVGVGWWLGVVELELPLAAFWARKDPGLLQEGTSSLFSITWPTAAG